MPIKSELREAADDDEAEDIMPDVGPDAEQRARMRKNRGQGRAGAMPTPEKGERPEAFLDRLAPSAFNKFNGK